jgi:hypothetical protein
MKMFECYKKKMRGSKAETLSEKEKSIVTRQSIEAFNADGAPVSLKMKLK